MKDFQELKGKGIITTRLIQTYLDQWTIFVYKDGICIHSSHVDNEEFEIIKKGEIING